MAKRTDSSMAKSLCGACAPKQTAAITSCRGCSKDFCRKHFNDHRDHLSNNMHEVINKHDGLMQDLQLRSKQTSNRKANRNEQLLLKQIDDWKTKTIESVLRVANQATEEVQRLFSNKPLHDQLQTQMGVIAKELKEQQEAESFVEPDIDRWLARLQRIKKDLDLPTRGETDGPSLKIQNVNWNNIIQVQCGREDSRRYESDCEDDDYRVPCIQKANMSSRATFFNGVQLPMICQPKNYGSAVVYQTF